jgi:hypothetical protein
MTTPEQDARIQKLADRLDATKAEERRVERELAPPESGRSLMQHAMAQAADQLAQEKKRRGNPLVVTIGEPPGPMWQDNRVTIRVTDPYLIGLVRNFPWDNAAFTSTPPLDLTPGPPPRTLSITNAYVHPEWRKLILGEPVSEKLVVANLKHQPGGTVEASVILTGNATTSGGLSLGGALDLHKQLGEVIAWLEKVGVEDDRGPEPEFQGHTILVDGHGRFWRSVARNKPQGLFTLLESKNASAAPVRNSDWVSIPRYTVSRSYTIASEFAV